MIRIQNLGCIQIHIKQIQSTDRYAGRNMYTYCDWPFLWSPADLSHSSPKYHPLNRLNLAFYCDNLINLYKRFYYYLFDMQCPRRGLLWYLKKKTGVIFQDVTIWHLTSQKKNCIAFFYQSMTGHLSQP